MKQLLIIVGIFLSPLVFCDDIDDGIGIESGISAGNDLQKSMNIKYIVRKAKAKAENNVNKDGITVGGTGRDGGTNVGGVDMVGSNVRGDIIIIQDIGDVTSVR